MAGSGSVITTEFNALLTHFGGKVQKDRISALLCCNLDGSHKLKPKYPKKCCFFHIRFSKIYDLTN